MKQELQEELIELKQKVESIEKRIESMPNGTRFQKNYAPEAVVNS